ncbi:MAG: PhoPQ-activated pathogenicity, partial [Verrucomicrobiales bacterium VVV1]
WQRTADGTLTVTAKTKPTAALLWQATNPNARDFRLETVGPVWTSTPLTADGDTFTAKTVAPSAGWTSSFIELTFDVGARDPLKLTTDIAVTPDTLPFPSHAVEMPKGFLQNAAKPTR